MIEWIEELKRDCKTELGKKPCVLTLATLRNTSAGPTPDARCVVLRDTLPDGGLLFSSDTRSKKNAQLRLNASATAVLWLPGQRKQFRFDGKVQILDEKSDNSKRHEIWQASSDAARGMFYWPAPGEPRKDTDSFPGSITADQAIPASFAVLILAPEKVETLDLTARPHLRIKWSMKSDVWTSSTINP